MRTDLSASRAPEASWRLAGCVFTLTVTLIVIHATGAAPFIKSYMRGVLPW